MKVTASQISEGIARYVDRELVPKVPGIRKWILGASGAYIGNIVSAWISRYSDILSKTGVMSEDGMIDLDSLVSSLRKTASENGQVTEHMPIIGDVTFDSSDIEKLYSYIVS